MPLKKCGAVDVLCLSGSPEEMGWEHGAAMKTEIQVFVETFLRRSESLFKVPYPFLLEKGQLLQRYLPAPYEHELRALAESSETPYEALLAWNGLPDIDSCYMQRVLQCCNFVVLPALSPDGGLVHGRNLDFPAPPEVLASAGLAICRKPARAGAIPTVSVGWVGMVGLYTGCNAASISIGNVAAPTKLDSLDGMPMGILLRQTLEFGHDLGSVCRIVTGAPRTCGFNIAAAHAAAAAACAIECTTQQCAIRPSRKDYLVVDNLCLCEQTAQFRLTYPAGVLRHARMTQLLETLKHHPQDLKNLLRDRFDLSVAEERKPNYPECYTICNFLTAHSVLFDLTSNKMWVSHKTAPAPLAEYAELDLEQCWSPKTATGRPSAAAARTV